MGRLEFKYVVPTSSGCLAPFFAVSDLSDADTEVPQRCAFALSLFASLSNRQSRRVDPLPGFRA